MATPVDASLAPELILSDGYTVKVTAVDPVTGDLVAGVTVSDVSLFVRRSEGVADFSETYGPFMFVPGPGA